MHTDTLAFLDHLFRRCQAFTDAAITFTAIHPDGQHPTPSRHIVVSDQDRLLAALNCLERANQLGWGAYVAVGLRRRGLIRWQRGGTADVIALPALFVDVDDGTEATRTGLMTASPTPSLLVHSGGGYHAYWLLEEPTTDLPLADRILRGLARHFKGDHLSPAASLRLPGTRNTKPEREGAQCHLLEALSRRYCLLDFSHFTEPECLSLPKHGNSTHAGKRLNPDLIDAVVRTLYRDYRAGQPRGDWTPSLCPCGRARDSPGAHFFFNPHIGCGRCHGRHGTLRLSDLCSLMGIDAAAYGGIFMRKDTSV